jgi:hypothetical protein
MRVAFLFPLPITLVAVAGCGSHVKEQATRSDLERDLTLVSKSPETEIASPIELGRLPTQSGSTVSLRRTVRHRPAPRLTASAPRTVRVAAAAPATTTAPAPSSVVQPTNTAPVPADNHELPPGKTVTVIPVSNGPSTAGGGGRGPDAFPTPGYGTGGSGMGGGGSGMGGGGSGMGGGGSGMGGDCPRPDLGPGVGLAGRPRGLLY